MGEKVIETFETICGKYSEKTAIILSKRRITYSELKSEVDRWKEVLSDSGIRKNDKAIITIEDRYQFISIWFALWKLECVPIPLESIVNKNELESAIKSSRCQWILSEETFNKEYLLNQYKYKQINGNSSALSRTEYKSMDSDIEEGAFYVYSSGTTGSPKCVMYDQAACWATVDSLVNAYHLKESDIILTPMTPSLPATMFTAILPALLVGATLILPNEPIPGLMLKLMKNEKVTVFFAVPYFYNLINEASKVRGIPDNLVCRLYLSTSAYLTPKVFEEFYKLFDMPIYSMFCTSEAMYNTMNTSDNYEVLKKSVGKPQKGVQIHIADENGVKINGDKEGEIIIGGTHLSKGYFNEPELMKKVYRDNLVYTGDLGYMDGEGNLYITGRISNTINIGGYLVNPQEVEDIILGYKGVKEAFVYPEIQEEREIVACKIVLDGQNDLSKRDLINHAKGLMNHYKVPEKVYIVDEIEKGRYGKIRRFSKT